MSRSKRFLHLLGLCGVGLAFLGTGPSPATAAPVALFTTVQDFTGWSNGGGSPVVSYGPVTTYDADGATTDGLANNGASGTGGSMQINTGNNAIGYTFTVFSSPNLLYNTAAMQQIDPGFTTPGTTVASSNTMYLTYTAPQFTGPNVYYQVGVDLAYAGDGYYGFSFGGTPVNDGIIDGQTALSIDEPGEVGRRNTGFPGNFAERKRLACQRQAQ